MDKEKLESLWNTVSLVGENCRLEYGEMVTLGSVFGQMRSVIEEQQKEIERMKGLFGEKQQWVKTITFAKNDKNS